MRMTMGTSGSACISEIKNDGDRMMMLMMLLLLLLMMKMMKMKG